MNFKQFYRKTPGSQMNIHETANAIVNGSDITALFHVVGQTIKGYAMPVLYGMKSLYNMWCVRERKER